MRIELPVATMAQVVTVAIVVAPIVTAVRAGYDSDPAGLAVELLFTVVGVALVVLYVRIACAAVMFAWRGFAIEVTPVGVWTRGPRFDRLIPWPALAYGGPPRTELTADWLELVVVRPELVTQRGWGFGDAGWGPGRYPRVMLAVRVHPWFVADAIRWYVEHPAERDALGTPGAQDRLIAALTNAPRPPYAWPPLASRS